MNERGRFVEKLGGTCEIVTFDAAGTENQAREVFFRIFFLVSMIPIPEPTYSAMAGWVRQVTGEDDLSECYCSSCQLCRTSHGPVLAPCHHELAGILFSVGIACRSRSVVGVTKRNVIRVRGEGKERDRGACSCSCNDRVREAW